MPDPLFEVQVVTKTEVSTLQRILTSVLVAYYMTSAASIFAVLALTLKSS